MADALTAAASIMNTDMERMNIIAHNLANTGTVGYKRQMSLAVPFTERMNVLGGNRVNPFFAMPLNTVGPVTDFSSGPVRYTGNPLDIAIPSPNAFFEIQTEQGSAYTRRGTFQVDPQGRLVTDQGHVVVGETGDIVLRSPQPVIDAKGQIFEQGQLIGSLRVVSITNPETMDAGSGGLFLPGDKTQVDAAKNVPVRQGFVEMPNLSSVQEMVRLMETMRHFEAAQKIVQGYDDMMDKALRKIGEF